MKIILFFLILTSITGSILAAELVEGDMVGNVKFNSQNFIPTTFVVQSTKDGDEVPYKIEMLHDERLFDFENLRLTDKQITFELDTGQIYSCVLSRDETVKEQIADCQNKNGYCGECKFPQSEISETSKIASQKIIIINVELLTEEVSTQEQDSSDQLN